MAKQTITRAVLKKSLKSRAEASGGFDDIKKDAIENYLDARERMFEAVERRKRMVVCDAESEELLTCDRSITAALSQMEISLSLLGETPASKRRQGFEDEIRLQLEQKGLRGPVFDERIAQVLALWDAFQDANRSLRERGRSYVTVSSSGKEYEKDNSATRDIVTMAKAIQDLLNDLGVSVKDYSGDGEDDEL